jgi:hypothetical protein
MARAAVIRFHGDEEWYEAAGIMVEVMWHAGEAAGLPPLEGRPNCQDHLQDFMDGEFPNGDRTAGRPNRPVQQDDRPASHPPRRARDVALGVAASLAPDVAPGVAGPAAPSRICARQ